MKSLMYHGNQEMKLEDIPLPEPENGEVIIKIKAVGVCGSDVEGYLGKTGRRIPPMVMGHEMAGIVTDHGSSKNFNEGDRVVIQPKLYCSNCDYCQSGLTHMCPQAKFLGVMETNGGMTEYVAVPENYLFKFKKDVSFTHASLVEPLAVACRAINKVEKKKLQDGAYTMVIGGGTIGLLVLQLLKLKGVDNVIVSDLCTDRLKKALKMGADYIVNPLEDKINEKIKDITHGNFVDYVFEAVGVSASASQSIDVLKNCGTAVWIGNAQKMIDINMQRIVTSEIEIKGTYIYTDQDFKKALQLIEKRRVDLDKIISAERKLIEGVKVFQELADNDDGKIIKVILIND